jgi:hypothetical protein
LKRTPPPAPPDVEARWQCKEESLRRNEDELWTLCDELLAGCEYEPWALDSLMLLVWNIANQKDSIDSQDVADRLIDKLYAQTPDSQKHARPNNCARCYVAQKGATVSSSCGPSRSQLARQCGLSGCATASCCFTCRLTSGGQGRYRLMTEGLNTAAPSLQNLHKPPPSFCTG